MEKTHSQIFNNGTLKVWFYIDNIRFYDEQKHLLEKDDQFICFYNFKEPTILCLGEIIRNPENQIIIMSSKNSALNNGINYVINKYNLKD
ncbi:MAG: hypothetical protein P8H13_05940 [Polaribacter sp.]|nr:hypothetical protein [Polaribacter sp.]MDG1994576.1 hypothetical protein [Polaribacter sp.]